MYASSIISTQPMEINKEKSKRLKAAVKAFSE
jgi:hypothetical protein